MNNIYVETESKKYPICFEEGFEGLKELVKETGLTGRKLMIVADSKVSPIYAETVKNILKDSFSEISICEFEAGEKNKNIETLSTFYDFCLDNKLDRKSVIAGLGGGVCGDMAGFCAASFMRGVTFVQIPTTLLAQVDSSVGGKVAIDYRSSKNVVGAFYQPDFVYINIDTLKTLPKREFNAGIGEVIKYGPMADLEFYNYIKENKEKIKNLDKDTMKHVIRKCCEIKADVVSKDEKEGGIREILNYGHTIGHAIETVKDFTLLHGECVAVGMVCAMTISIFRGDLKEADREELINLLKYFELPYFIENINKEDVYNQMFFDKKVKENKIEFVLNKTVGEVYRTMDVTKEEIMKALDFVVK
ncbi:MAG: 3-dehydroquinate synthase [Anaerotignaceae bacterium]